LQDSKESTHTRILMTLKWSSRLTYLIPLILYVERCAQWTRFSWLCLCPHTGGCCWIHLRGHFRRKNARKKLFLLKSVDRQPAE
jgi:hypothetical protein